MGVVEDIYERNSKREHLARSRRSRGVISLRKAVEKKGTSGLLALIAEFKRRSPSGFSSGLNGMPPDYFGKLPLKRVAAFSVLTEPSGFGGDWADLSSAQEFGIPLLAKDFFSSENMIHDAYLAGADSVLLIADFLEGGRIAELADYSASLGMDALVEFHDPGCFQKIPVRDNVLVGYNRRDLRTMKMESREREIAEEIRTGDMPLILESGIDAENAKSMGFSGYHGILVGTSLISGESVIEVLAGRGLL